MSRWFEPSEIQMSVSSLLSNLANIPPADPDAAASARGNTQMRNALIAGGGAVAFLVVVMGALLLFAEPQKGKKADYPRLALVSLGLIATAAGVTWFVSGNNNKQRALRDEAFEEISRRYQGLKPARGVEVNGISVGTIPWFHTEEWIHVYGRLVGEHQGEQIAAVECSHIIDPVTATTDSELLQGLANLGASKHKRLKLRLMDATVFVEPLANVPDIVIVPKMDPSRAYYRRALRDQDCDLATYIDIPKRVYRKYYLASSSPEQCEGIFDGGLGELLSQRKWCIVQVLAGHCVVITSNWYGPNRAPQTADAVDEDLQFAAAVQEQIKQFAGLEPAATAPPLAATAEPHSRDAELPTADAAPTPASRTNKTSPKTRKARHPYGLGTKALLLLFGLPLLLIGFLGSAGTGVILLQGSNSVNWPHVEGEIVESSMDERQRTRRGKPVSRYKPIVRYAYEVDGEQHTSKRIAYGVTRRTENRKEIEEFLADYPIGAKVPVYYSPSTPGSSVLKPGLKDRNGFIVALAMSGGMFLLGAWMLVAMYRGRRIKRKKPAAQAAPGGMSTFGNPVAAG